MLRPMDSPQDSHDEHLRRLLDQRATRADLPGRFSTLSQFSDTPSVYSRPFFSPRPVDEDIHSPSAEYQYNPPANLSASAHYERTTRDRLNDPATSILDLDESRSSTSFSDVYGDDQNVEDEDDEPLPRMSLLGPKMRFHSRAPWELDDDILQEEDEPDYGTLLPKKSFGFSSGRTSSNSRPSGESTRSQTKSKKSFETTSSQISYPRGALYALAQESLSTSALGPSYGIAQNTSHTKSGFGRVRSESPNLSLSPPVSPNLDPRSPTNAHFSHSSSSPNEPSLPLPDNGTLIRSNTPPSLHLQLYPDNDVHPYANPDLVIPYPEVQLHPPNDHNISRSDSITTVTNSTSSTSMAKSGMPTSTTPKNRASTLQRKEISSPMSVSHGNLRANISLRTNEDHSLQLPNNLPGWTDRVTPPTFALISLEEARAQRLRSATVVPEPSSDVLSHKFEQESERAVNDSNPRVRGRSISAGAKAKNALQSVVGGGGGQLRPEKVELEYGMAHNGGLPGKILKHKKSGFMRLFNGGRVQEKEEKALPPPLPSLSDVHIVHNTQQATQKVPKMSVHRVPVPELSPPSPEVLASTGHEVSPYHNTAYLKSSPNLKRALPPLSINTLSQVQISHGAISTVDDALFQTLTAPPCNSERSRQDGTIPQSAPASGSDFPALKLRPVSTMFSAHFSDHIVLKESRSSLETDISTPGSSSNIFSPVTPTSSSPERISSDKPSIGPIFEDQSSTIKVLEDQKVSTKATWQQHIHELESEIRDLKAEVELLRNADHEVDYCSACGRGRHTQDRHQQFDDGAESKSGSVVHRPRARTGTSSRFGSSVS